ncbi:restriction endonuclease subunit S [Corallococcus sp. AB038B]|uniref:restriction endonuclease subunit S n=1 Tax=Corallococcus sp. AB038B TaxID=2316718 RepID=UPI000EEAB5E0|nr:restriction endonuclease subunit S [Corallococcus sp. AB038B]RKI05074.1 restriction endonuclease subunit S [Corallococcus sp. AB038B]
MSVVEQSLGEVIHYLRGITFKPEEKVEPDADDAVVCMRTKNVQEGLDESDLIAVPASLVRRDELYLRAGDILLSSANSWNLVGKVCRVPQLRYKATAGGFISVVRPRENVDSRFLYHWLASPDVQERIRGCARQTTNISNLSVPQFEQLRIPVPPLAEQRRIADILDKADAIRRKRTEAIALTKELLRSAFLEMFGDPVTNPKGWPVKPFAELVSETQLGLVRAAAEQGDDRAYSYVRMNAIRSDGHMDLSNLTRVDASEDEVESSRLMDGDFLFNTRNSRELVGKAAVYHGDGTHLFNNNILRVRFRSGVESDFVSAYWQTSAGQQHLEARKAGTTSVFAIYYKSLATLPVPVPPAHAQAKYADVCAATRKHLRTDEAYVEEADTLFNSLVARAFSGALEASR